MCDVMLKCLVLLQWNEYFPEYMNIRREITGGAEGIT
jgi:hypothetical protein